MLSGFIFLNQIAQSRATKTLSGESIKYIVGSAFLFGLAVMSKPTAFIDVAGFGLLLGMTWLGALLLIGGTFALIGVLAKLEILNMRNFVSKADARWYTIPGVIIALVDPVRSFVK